MEKEIRKQYNNNIIHKWITAEDTIYEKLKESQRKVKDQKIIKVYTDGSLEDHNMGIGWVIQDQEGENHITFRCNIEYFPSSTRAELAAILTTLLVMPKEAVIHIYTDNHMERCSEFYNSTEICGQNNNNCCYYYTFPILKSFC
ncbi:hypothetical protein Glove_372g77 [Diversispora epigaea]|uniref:RNase H type-1 domain-containing protein n=1 Tax=Diversispora epigaea TaxID=1348612 RepID=A0A397HE40_9GLOM|nr:hypothetical protein Glove_372g77 [Diversispora epigaea]